MFMKPQVSQKIMSAEIWGFCWVGLAPHWSWSRWPCHLLELQQESWSWPAGESWPPNNHTPEKDSPNHGGAPHLDRVSELTLSEGVQCEQPEGIRKQENWPLICHVVAKGKRKMPSGSHPTPPLAGGRADPHPRVTRVGKLALPLTCCSTQDSGPCIPSDQRTRTDNLVEDTSEPSLRPWEKASWCKLPTPVCLL